MPANRLDARFSQGTLYVFSEDETQLIRGWQIGELLLAGNHPVGTTTRRAIEDWLASHRL